MKGSDGVKYSKTVIRKLILGFTALSLTTVCLVSTTFAWFAKNANAWTDEFQIDIHINEGLEISVDGNKFYESITKDQITKAIALKKYNQLNPDNLITYNDLTDEIVNEYGKVTVSPVTPDNDFNFYGFDAIDYPVKDLTEYLEEGFYTPVNLTLESTRKSYVEFDLTFRAISSTEDPKEKYNLIFLDKEHSGSTSNRGTPQSYIESTDVSVKLSNDLNIDPELDNRDNPKTKGLYESGEIFTANPKDAMRIATKCGNIINVFEPNAGYSSSAYKDGEGIYSPDINPMVTYFNNTHNLGKLKLLEDKVFDTEKDFDGFKTLGVFERDAQGNYSDVTLTFYIWLDGYDGDFIEGMSTNKIDVYLSFTKVGV